MSLEPLSESASKIICIGRSYVWNYGGTKPDPLPEPLLFIKPTTAFTSTGKTIDIPQGCDCLYEVELAVVIGKEAKNVRPKDADSYVAGYALGLDFVAKNIHLRSTAKGYPWAVGKGFDTFNPIGRFIPKDEVGDPHQIHLEFRRNGTPLQSGSTSDLIYTIPQIVSYASGIFTLLPGDVIMTGTPEGVGTIDAGDKVEATLSVGGKVLDELKLDARWREGGYNSDKVWLEALEG